MIRELWRWIKLPFAIMLGIWETIKMRKHKIPVARIIESDHKNKPKLTGREMFETAIRALWEIKNMKDIDHAREIANEALNKIKQR